MIAISIIVGICIFLYVLLILYFLFGWIKLEEYTAGKKNCTTKVSVIIPVRNEEKNIKNLLDDLREQLYNRELFEIIVVDDFSTDNTAEVVKNANINNLKIISLAAIFQNKQALKANKKAGIQLAVEQASGELIITTDADCHVLPRHKFSWQISDFGFFKFGRNCCRLYSKWIL